MLDQLGVDVKRPLSQSRNGKFLNLNHFALASKTQTPLPLVERSFIVLTQLVEIQVMNETLQSLPT